MSTLALMPPPSPALTVHQAAARIRTLAERALERMARNEYWAGGWAVGVTNALGGEEGELAGLFTPELAIQFADWLDTAASHNARYGTPLPEFALTAARALTP
ncbi:MAG TPA: hypothetical protein VIP77_02695 [Jiangellaceae bacterium]